MVNSHVILFSEIKERLGDQFSSVSSLDTKAGISLGLIGAIVAGLINSMWFVSLPFFILLPVLLLTIISTIFLLLSLLVRDFHKDPEPSALIQGYEGKSEDETRATLIRNYATNFSDNKKFILKKKQYMNLGFIFSFLSILTLCWSVLISTPTLNPFNKGGGM